jgi:hypothetical protein
VGGGTEGLGGRGLDVAKVVKTSADVRSGAATET